jgi:hypothetical protein
VDLLVLLRLDVVGEEEEKKTLLQRRHLHVKQLPVYENVRNLKAPF